MDNIRKTINRLFSPIKPLPAGLYHYQAPPDDPRNYRLHLRLEEDGNGILIINASTVLHLNQTAAEYAYYLVLNQPAEQVARKMASRYQVDKEHSQQDYLDLIDRIQALINTPDLDPVTFLGLERKAPFTGSIPAPYRLDIALTYNLPSTVDPASAPAERVAHELTTAEWHSVLDKAWSVGIPHIVFTGGEPTMRADLVELIAMAEANGQVTGLLSDGLRLADKGYLDSLLQTGLDHLMLILHPDDELAWTALQNAMDADIFVAVHLTITEFNQGQVRGILDRLRQLDVPAVSLSMADQNLNDALQDARDYVAGLNLELVWNLPVPYSAMNPIALETQQNGAQEGAGKAWLYIEPDGDVLPGQGISRVLGNLLKDPWEKIWKG